LRKIYSWNVLRVRVASRNSFGYISHEKSIAQEGKRGSRKVAGIRWIIHGYVAGR